MTNLGWLFPGQASQKVGMGLDLYNETELGKEYFDTAQEILNCDIKSIVFQGPEEKLKQTEYTQPAIYIVSVILGHLMMDKGIKPNALAGHSLGEYSALTLAESFNFNEGLELVKIRVLEMQKACENNSGSMAAILGLEDNIVEEICESYKNGIVVAANFNAKGQVVISGEKDAIKNIMVEMLDAGAMKAIELNVSGAFHSPLMSSAKKILAEKLLSAKINNSKFPVYANVSSKPISNESEIRKALIDQLESPVQWHQIISNMIYDGVKLAIEVGPGRVLKGLSKRIDRSLNMTSIESHEEIINYQYV